MGHSNTQRRKPHAPVQSDAWGSVAFAAFMLLVLVLPLPYAGNRPWAVGLLLPFIMLPVFIWAVGVALGRIVFHLPQGNARLFFLIFFALCCYFEVTRRWVSTDQAASLLHANQLWLMFFSSLVLHSLLKVKPDRLPIFMWVVVVAGVLQTVLGITLFISAKAVSLFYETVDHPVVKGSFINRNHLASYLNMALACGVGLMVAEFADSAARVKSNTGQRYRQAFRASLEFMMSTKMLLRVLLIVMVIGLIGTRSRAGNGILLPFLLPR